MVDLLVYTNHRIGDMYYNTYYGKIILMPEILMGSNSCKQNPSQHLKISNLNTLAGVY